MNKEDRLNVGIFRVRMGRGGSEARTMWAMQALKKDYDVTLVTTGEVDLKDLNAFYGTSIHPSDISVRKAPVPRIMTSNAYFAVWRGAWYQRFCRKIAPCFDILISTYNLCDFGVPAIHYLADFSWDPRLRQRFDPIPKNIQPTTFKAMMYAAYQVVGKMLSNHSVRNLFGGKDLIVANSKWSAQIVAQEFEVNVDVIYPPVADNLSPVENKNMSRNDAYGFVYIGRIYPEKRIEKIVSILKKIRQKGHAIHLHLIGDTQQTAYGQEIERLCRLESEWIHLDGELCGAQKWKVLSQHRFAINARTHEPFGISIAEMVKAGCIPFIPAGGGQMEIVKHPALIYTSEKDAVSKISAVLTDKKLQSELQHHLNRQGQKFSIHRFQSDFLTIFDHFLKTRKFATRAN